MLQLNFQSQKADETLQSKITNEEWQLEMERVMPSLKLTIQTGNSFSVLLTMKYIYIGACPQLTYFLAQLQLSKPNPPPPS